VALAALLIDRSHMPNVSESIKIGLCSQQQYSHTVKCFFVLGRLAADSGQIKLYWLLQQGDVGYRLLTAYCVLSF